MKDDAKLLQSVESGTVFAACIFRTRAIHSLTSKILSVVTSALLDTLCASNMSFPQRQQTWPAAPGQFTGDGHMSALVSRAPNPQVSSKFAFPDGGANALDGEVISPVNYQCLHRKLTAQVCVGASAKKADRKVRFSLPAMSNEDDSPVLLTKSRKIQTLQSIANSDASASTEVVKEWAKACCEEVIGCSASNPWDPDSDDESALESGSEFGGRVDEDEMSVDQDGVEEEMDQASTAVASAIKNFDAEARAQDASGSHEKPSYVAILNPDPLAGLKRKADQTSFFFDLVERPKKRRR